MDCEALAVFFNSLADLDNNKREMTLSVNEQEFNNRKSCLVSKLQDCISKCQTSNTYSVASVCCIWNDYFGTFLKPFLGRFQQKLEADLANVQNITPVHQQEIVQLEAEIKAAETKYQENVAKANNETDPVKKAKFVALANEALDEVKKLKNRYSQNPVANLGKFDYSNDWQRLIGGNLTSEPPTPPSSNPNLGGSKGGSGFGGGSTSWTPWSKSPESNNPQSSPDQTRFLIFAGIGLLIFFFFMNQKEHD